jgi:beta-galactosidase
MKKCLFWFLCFAGMWSFVNICIAETARTYLDFDSDWLFSRGDFPSAPMPAFNDSPWRKLNLPHDWSIEGPFDSSLGSGTGYAPGGIAWYRKHFKLDPAHKDKLVAVEFDGVYNNAEVWINGQFVGRRPYGYSSFYINLSPYLNFGKDENVLAVRVDHTRLPDSRWYTGSGIYRHVRLRIYDKLHVGRWGTFVSTPQIKLSTSGTKDDVATVRIETTVENNTGSKKGLSLQSEVLDPDGRFVDSRTSLVTVDNGSRQTFVQQILVDRAKLWSLESPQLYTLNTSLSVGAKVVDGTSTPFGIRSAKFEPDKGFTLNGKSLKIKGVCIHHDAGCLGAAVPEKVLERRLRLLQDLGVNAIRTSHNPPAPELLDLCDRLGLLVMDEAFDEFTPGKNKWVAGWNTGLPSRFGYSEFFDQWANDDIRDMILRDRNHPCVVIWSIGNEIDYANDPFSHPVLDKEYKPGNPSAEDMVKCARPLIAAVKELDSTRPVTAALANVAMSDAVGFCDLLDIAGYNYQEQRYADDHKKYAKRVIIGSENYHTFAAWVAVRDNQYISGQFLWTGVDYLGEAGRWPNRGADFGLLDLCGFKKPSGWFRQSLWTDKPMVYICASAGGGDNKRHPKPEEHWNWSKGQTVAVFCYTNCPEVQLSLNGKSVGTKKLKEATDGVLTWQIPYEPGRLAANGLVDGKTACQYNLITAGKAGKIRLNSDTTELIADGKGICHLIFEIVDANGVLVPDAANELKFEISGPAAVIGIGNGALNDIESCKDLAHKAFQGRGLAIIQSQNAAGKISIKVSSPGLESAAAALTVSEPPKD